VQAAWPARSAAGAGGKWDVCRSDVYLGGDLFRVRFPDYEGGPPAIASLTTLDAKRDLALAALDANSDVDAVSLASGAEALKARLEILLGARTEAPDDVSMQRQEMDRVRSGIRRDGHAPEPRARSQAALRVAATPGPAQVRCLALPHASD